jgi:hypothetical protein
MKVDPERDEVMGPGWEEIRNVRQDRLERWERRSAQWAALDLARAVFGNSTRASLAPFPSRGGIRGLLTLAVPFHAMEDHRRREQQFLSLASRDPVLQQVTLLFVFEIHPATVSSGGSR